MTEWSNSHVDQVARRLRAVGALPIGGRGLNAPAFAPQHLSALIIALGATEDAVGAQEAHLRYFPMVAKGADFRGQLSLGEAVSFLLSDPDLADSVERLTICRSWPEAIIEFTENRKIVSARYLPRETPDDFTDLHAVRIDTTYHGGLLHQLALDLAEEPNAEWTAELPEDQG